MVELICKMFKLIYKVYYLQIFYPLNNFRRSQSTLNPIHYGLLLLDQSSVNVNLDLMINFKKKIVKSDIFNNKSTTAGSNNTNDCNNY